MPVLSRVLATSRPAPPAVTLMIELPASPADSFVAQDLTITYRPSALVVALFDQDRSLLEHLPSFVSAWDLFDERGNPYPITPDAVSRLPPAVVSTLLTGLVEHELWRNPDLPPGRKGRVVRTHPGS
jgi:hypothetical protein